MGEAQPASSLFHLRDDFCHFLGDFLPQDAGSNRVALVLGAISVAHLLVTIRRWAAMLRQTLLLQVFNDLFLTAVHRTLLTFGLVDAVSGELLGCGLLVDALPGQE